MQNAFFSPVSGPKFALNLDNGGRVYSESYGGRITWGFSLPDGSEGSGYPTVEAAEQAAAECIPTVDAE